MLQFLFSSNTKNIVKLDLIFAIFLTMTIIQNYSSEFYYLFSQAAPRAGRPGRRGAQAPFKKKKGARGFLKTPGSGREAGAPRLRREAPRRSRGAQAFFKKSLGSFFF